MSVTAAGGFVANGGAVGIKPDSVPDVAVVATETRAPVPAAAVFTTNLACAAPVQVSRAHLADGTAAAVVLSSGNANAATGEQGRADARRMCELTAQAIGAESNAVLVCSTGLIGIPMPMAPVEQGIPIVAKGLRGGPDAGAAAATAILTTDTRTKEAVAPVALGPTRAMVGGMAKGAAMLAPSMATMLALLTTDVRAEPAVLRRALADGVGTFVRSARRRRLPQHERHRDRPRVRGRRRRARRRHQPGRRSGAHRRDRRRLRVACGTDGA